MNIYRKCVIQNSKLLIFNLNLTNDPYNTVFLSFIRGYVVEL